MIPNQVERRSPRRARISPWERLGQGLEQMLGASGAPAVRGSRPWSPDLRILDKPREVVIQLVSRDIDPRKIRIQLSGRVLTLSGASHDRHPDHHGYHAFKREIVLPAEIDGARVNAQAGDTLLTVRLGKRRRTTPESPAPERPQAPAKVRDLMTCDVLSVAPEMPVSDVAGLLDMVGIGSVPVCRADGTLLGILTDRDIAVRVTAKTLDPTKTTAGEVMTPDPVTCSADDALLRAEQLMADAQVRRLPVVDAKGTLVGYLAMAKIARRDQECRAGRLLREISEPAPGRE
jgi:CBS domain-containing protein/HSP20 family molecular chaperone IbpA